MRIISGKYKGRGLKMPKGIRPTQNKVRKAVFDILGDIQGESFLELFAGSGAVGIEALSQGAKQVVFVENDTHCLRILEDNLSRILPANYYLLSMDYSRAIKELTGKKFKFDVIFLDPPYYNELARKTLQMLCACDILSPCGYIVAQHFKKDNLPDAVGDLILFKQNCYGDTVLTFYKKCAK